MSELIPFNTWSQERIDRGMKICTSRHRRYSKDPRVTYIYLYEAEGARDPKELQQVIDGIYGRHVPDDEMFYVHWGDFRGEKA